MPAFRLIRRLLDLDDVSGTPTAGASLQYDGTQWVPSSTLSPGYWGSFWNTQDQTATGDDEANAITVNASDGQNNGVSVVSNSQITFANAGVYNLQFSAQIDRDSGSGLAEVDIWLSKNGANVADTNTRVTVSGSASQAKMVAAWNLVVKLAASDYLELYWSTTDDRIILHAEGTQSNPTRPAIPSVIITATQVSA